MIEFLDRERLWPTVGRLLARPSGRGRNLVAVPYVGKGAARLLPLRPGDVLVCALTLANCRSSAVCPKEVRKLKRRGVRVYTLDDLHAKVYLLGDCVVVGSANASWSSASDLDEAAIISTDSAALGRARAWFEWRMHSPVGNEWLRRCEAAYRTPRFGHRREASGRAQARTWIIGVTDAEFPEQELRLSRAVARNRQRRGRPNGGFEHCPIRWPGGDRLHRLISEGDTVVADWDGVRKPAKVLRVKRGRSATGGRVAYFSVEIATEDPPLSWRQFRSECERGGLNLGNAAGAREVKRGSHVRLVERILARRVRPAGRPAQ